MIRPSNVITAWIGTNGQVPIVDDQAPTSCFAASAVVAIASSAGSASNRRRAAFERRGSCEVECSFGPLKTRYLVAPCRLRIVMRSPARRPVRHLPLLHFIYRGPRWSQSVSDERCAGRAKRRSVVLVSSDFTDSCSNRPPPRRSYRPAGLSPQRCEQFGPGADAPARPALPGSPSVDWRA
jgi:hypothetical protein